MNGRQGGEPAKLATALVTLSALAKPPVCLLAGADAVETAERKAVDLIEQANAHHQRSYPMQHDDA